MTDTDQLAATAQAHLERLAGPEARLRDDQLAAIRALAVDAATAVVVQRTGWGKSAVYWVATALRRAAGAGPTLVVSPLLALMRDQVDAARRMGLSAATLNSSNADDWADVEAELAADRVDVLLISPERLNAAGFRARVLPHLAPRIGMLVIDEAHTISDWGHDFRPDYRRIRDVIAGLPPGTPVLATTATANSRVTADIARQIGSDTVTLRGTLDRESLALDGVRTDSAAARYAWIAAALGQLDGSGIIYALTVSEAERLAAWLAEKGHAVRAYSGQVDAEERLHVEASLRSGELKAVVATSALGMGFDHPALAFVLHSGAPSTVIAYYQQVGRAGRALSRAVAVLLPGAEDQRIWEYFTSTAMPPAETVAKVLGALEAAGAPLTVPALEAETGVRRGRLEALLKVLDVDGAVAREGSGYRRTEAPYVYDTEHHAAVAALRRGEQRTMLQYLDTSDCLMQFLRTELDDPEARPCGRCARCVGAAVVPVELRDSQVREALQFLRSQPVVLPPRKMWPSAVSGRRGRIPSGLHEGRALALAGDAGWGQAVEEALRRDHPVPPEVLDGVVGVLRQWGWPAGRPTWVCPVPSRRHEALVTDLAGRLAELGRMQLVPALTRVTDTPWQETLETSAGAASSALDALRVGGPVPAGPVLLVDDVANSGWTLTVAAVLLTEAGAGPVYPLVLRRRP
ncbi:MAG: DEAD/DEAH box helicase [Actinomycetes bacterium]